LVGWPALTNDCLPCNDKYILLFQSSYLQLQTKFPLAPMGVLTPGSAHARPSFRPPITLVNIFWHTCLQSHLQTSPQPLRSHIRNLRTIWTTFLIFKTIQNWPTFTNAHKKCTLRVKVHLYFFVDNCLIRFDVKNAFFKNILRVKIFHMYGATLCKIAASMNKICGNESKNRLNSKQYNLGIFQEI
jgi:hypothetical protein